VRRPPTLPTLVRRPPTLRADDTGAAPADAGAAPADAGAASEPAKKARGSYTKKRKVFEEPEGYSSIHQGFK
jgi:hypothetical protein